MQRFYGGGVQSWLSCNIILLQKYINSIKKLKARESLMKITEVAVGTGSLKIENIRKILHDLKKDAFPNKTNKKKLTKSQQQFMLASMRIKLE